MKVIHVAVVAFAIVFPDEFPIALFYDRDAERNLRVA